MPIRRSQFCAALLFATVALLSGFVAQARDVGVTSVITAPVLTDAQTKIVDQKLDQAKPPHALLHLSAISDAGGGIAVDHWASSSEADKYVAAMQSAFDAIKLPLSVAKYQNNQLSIPDIGAWYPLKPDAKDWVLAIHVMPKLSPQQIDHLHELSAQDHQSTGQGGSSAVHLTALDMDGSIHIVDLLRAKDFASLSEMHSRVSKQVGIDSPFQVYRQVNAALGRLSVNYQQ